MLDFRRAENGSRWEAYGRREGHAVRTPTRRGVGKDSDLPARDHVALGIQGVLERDEMVELQQSAAGALAGEERRADVRSNDK